MSAKSISSTAVPGRTSGAWGLDADADTATPGSDAGGGIHVELGQQAAAGHGPGDIAYVESAGERPSRDQVGRDFDQVDVAFHRGPDCQRGTRRQHTHGGAPCCGSRPRPSLRSGHEHQRDERNDADCGPVHEIGSALPEIAEL